MVKTTNDLSNEQIKAVMYYLKKCWIKSFVPHFRCNCVALRRDARRAASRARREKLRLPLGVNALALPVNALRGMPSTIVVDILRGTKSLCFFYIQRLGREL